MLCIREVYILGEQRRRERKKQESCCVCTAKKRHALCTRFCTAETWLKAWNIGIHSAHRKKEINMYHCMFLTSGFSFLLILHIKLRLCIIKIPVLLWSRHVSLVLKIQGSENPQKAHGHWLLQSSSQCHIPNTCTS